MNHYMLLKSDHRARAGFSLAGVKRIARIPLLAASLLLIPGPFGWSAWTDSDTDGYADYWTSADGMVTLSLSLAPSGQNSDADSLDDFAEALAGTDPYSTDTDGDGLDDGFEVGVVIGTMGGSWSASAWDSDGDGYSDYDEWYVAQGLATVADFSGVYYGAGLPGNSAATFSDYDGDSIKNPDDPAPADAANFSSYNNSPWMMGDALSDQDSDGIINFYDILPNDASNGNGSGGGGSGPTDSDGDGLTDDVDPAPSDNTNASSFNAYTWPSDALGDQDSDGITNFYDAWPYDASNGTGGGGGTGNNDLDGDGYLDDVDPAPSDYANYSQANLTSWYSTALDDSDTDGTNNFSDPWPNDSTNGGGTSGGGGGTPTDSDLDGYSDDIDPASADPINYSYINSVSWYYDVFGDADGDGALNFWDSAPYVAPPPPPTDTDADGLSDDEEAALQTNPAVMDTDGDGLTDFEEVRITSSGPLGPYSVALSRGWVNSPYTDWHLLSTDSDGDQIPNKVEDYYAAQGLNKDNPADGWGDIDSDGVCNRAQFLAGIPITANLNKYDTDSDGIFDTYEDFFALDRQDFTDAVNDTDADGLMNYEEASVSLSPLNPTTRGATTTDLSIWITATTPAAGNAITRIAPGDLDGDALPDVWEHRFRKTGVPTDGTQIRIPDAAADPDGDGLSNWVEFNIGTNPTQADTDTSDTVASDAYLDSDGDGLTNAQEVALGTEAWNRDTDGDGESDADELAEGTDPLNPSSGLNALLGLRVLTPFASAD